MTDYGHDLRFGTMWNVAAEDTGHFADLAVQVEKWGLDLVTIADHPYSVIPGHPDPRPKTDAFTLLTTIAARTHRIRIAPNVANLPLRTPPMLARMAASLDLLYGGRFEMALGAGAMWDAIAAEGGPRRTPGEAVEAVEEAVAIMHALWTPGDPVEFAGRHYRLDGVHPGPFPLHPMEIWLGAYQPRMLRLIGRAGDGWLPSSPYYPPAAMAAGNKIIDEAAVGAGRAPEAIRRLYNIAGSFSDREQGFLHGPAKVWAEQLTDLTLTEGVSTYLLYLIEDVDTIRRFADEVAPAVREMVAAERAR
jgi:alkanesulfonate monooxygenase SsuD/methylene tetrahydromethanopterin reductase-like flavin-dependent oxidoreductase (luciferase family)